MDACSWSCCAQCRKKAEENKNNGCRMKTQVRGQCNWAWTAGTRTHSLVFVLSTQYRQNNVKWINAQYLAKRHHQCLFKEYERMWGKKKNGGGGEEVCGGTTKLRHVIEWWGYFGTCRDFACANWMHCKVVHLWNLAHFNLFVTCQKWKISCPDLF